MVDEFQKLINGSRDFLVKLIDLDKFDQLDFRPNNIM